MQGGSALLHIILKKLIGRHSRQTGLTAGMARLRETIRVLLAVVQGHVDRAVEGRLVGMFGDLQLL